MDYQGGDSGGGYTNNYGGGDGNPSSSQGGQTRRSYDQRTLIPVSIHMALKARPDQSEGDGSLVLEDGRKIYEVKLVAAVREVTDASTNVLYKVEDGTGVMDVKQMLHDTDPTAIQEIRQQTYTENIYVKIVGKIKDYANEKMLYADSVRPLSSGNELTHHMLSVVHSAEKFKRADAIVAVAPASMMMGNSGVGFGNASIPAAQSMGGGDSLKEKVAHYIRTGPMVGPDAGVSIVACMKSMPEFPEADIRAAFQLMSEEGQIYSTIDDEHYMLAE